MAAAVVESDRGLELMATDGSDGKVLLYGTLAKTTYVACALCALCA